MAGDIIEATAPVELGVPVLTGPRAVRVTDTISGDTTRVLAEDLRESRTFHYTRYLKASDKCRTFENTARVLQAQGPTPASAGIAPSPVVPVVLDTDRASVRICPPPVTPADPKPDPKVPPVVTIDNGDGTKPTVVPTKPARNPAGPVISNPKATGKMAVVTRASTRRARVGDVVTWAITVRNTGKADLSDVVVTDRLPRHLRAISNTKAPLAEGTRKNARLVRVPVGDVLVGGSVTIRVATKVVGRPVLTPGS